MAYLIMCILMVFAVEHLLWSHNDLIVKTGTIGSLKYFGHAVWEAAEVAYTIIRGARILLRT